MKSKKAFVMLLAFSVSLGGNNVHAAETTFHYDGSEMYIDVKNSGNLNQSLQDDIKLILDSGFTEKDIDCVSIDVIGTMADSLREDKNSVQIDKTVCTYDELENVEKLVNMSVSELVEETGMKKKEIVELKEQVEETINATDEELHEEYGLNDSEVKVFRKTAEKIDGYTPYKEVEEEDKVTLSTGIASSKLAFTQTICRKSASRVTYVVAECFNWKKSYYRYGCGFDDVIAVAWSGGFTFTTTGKKISYYTQYGTSFTGFYWGDKYATLSATANGTPSTGCVYSFAQDYNNYAMSANLAKSGTIQLRLESKYKNEKGKNAQIVSQYCHKGIGLSGVNISSSPTISVQGQYDVTDTDYTTNIIGY